MRPWFRREGRRRCLQQLCTGARERDWRDDMRRVRAGHLRAKRRRIELHRLSERHGRGRARRSELRCMRCGKIQRGRRGGVLAVHLRARDGLQRRRKRMRVVREEHVLRGGTRSRRIVHLHRGCAGSACSYVFDIIWFDFRYSRLRSSSKYRYVDIFCICISNRIHSCPIPFLLFTSA